jgi:hypothetical protein
VLRDAIFHFHLGKFLIALAGIANGGEREGKEEKEEGKERRRKRKRREKEYFPQPLSPTVPKPRFLIITFDFKQCIN